MGLRALSERNYNRVVEYTRLNPMYKGDNLEFVWWDGQIQEHKGLEWFGQPGRNTLITCVLPSIVQERHVQKVLSLDRWVQWTSVK
jgi:hypothetical protein